MNTNITLVPIGPIPAELLSWVVDKLAGIVGQSYRNANLNVVIGETVPVPVAAYDPRRRQYRGDALMAVLRALSYPDAGRVLGMTDADCYVPGLNFIFGQATSGGREAFVALPRLRQSFYGLLEDPVLFRERVLKEVIHELGHTWGLSHCTDVHCVMHFSNTLHDTDVKGANFCLRCRDRLG